MQKAAKAGFGCLVIIFALFCLIMIVVMRNRPTPEQEAARQTEREGFTAARVCQAAVRERLKSPAGAEFQAPRKASITELANGNFQVQSYVDAQNSFGATIRTPFGCTVSPAGAIVDLKIENRR